MNETTRKGRDHGGIHARRLLETGWSSREALGYSILKRTIDDACTSHITTAYAQSHGYPDCVDQTGCSEVNPGIAQVFVRDYDGDLEALTLPGDLAGSAQHHAGIALPVPLIRTAGGPPFARRVPA